MEQIEPEIYLIGRPSLDQQELSRFLKDIGAEEFKPIHTTSDAETICEVGGKICYNSFVPGLNPNVTSVRKGDYLQNIIAQGHGSVLAHSSFTFLFRNVSRVFTHELVRNAIGAAISQQSLRYCRLTDLDAYVPACIQSNDEALELFIETTDQLSEVQHKLAEIYDIDNLTFKEKKELTSAFRRLAPIGLPTMMMWTGNLRAIRNVIEQRTSPHAEEEIRTVFTKVFDLMKSECPAVFSDYNDKMETENKKV